MCIGLQSMPNTHTHTNTLYSSWMSHRCFASSMCCVWWNKGDKDPAGGLQHMRSTPCVSANDCRCTNMYHLPDFLQQIAAGTVRFADVYGHFIVFVRHHLDEIRWNHSECTHQRGAHETASQLVFHGIVVTITPTRPIIHEQLIGQSSLRVSSAGLTCQALLGHGRTHRKNKTKCSLESWEPIKIEIWNLSMSCSVETGRHVPGWQEQVHNWGISFLSVFCFKMQMYTWAVKKNPILTLCTHKGLSRILSFYFRGHNAGFRETTATTTSFADLSPWKGKSCNRGHDSCPAET